MDIVIAVLMNIVAVDIVRVAATGWDKIFLYAVIVACDVAFVVKKFKD